MAKADESASFSINLEDGTSGPAGTAANALENLRSKIKSEETALGQLQKAWKNLQGANVVNVAQARALRSAIDQKKNSIAKAQSAVLSLGGGLTQVTSKGKGASSIFEQLRKNASTVPGPLNAVVGKLEGISSAIGGGVLALGIVAVAAAMIALTAAAVKATVSLIEYGIGQADARRSELLRLEGLTKLRSYYGFAAGNANEMQTAVDKVSGSTAIGRGKLLEYTNQLYKMGLRGTNLTQTLEGMAIKASVQGEAQAKMFAGMAAGAALSGKSVKKLADDVKARLGGIAERQMLSLSVQTEKLHENFDMLFSGLHIEGLLTGLAQVNKLLSQNTATGRALKTLAEVMFKPIISMAEAAGPIVKRFFQGMVIGALVLGIAFLKVRNAIRDSLGGSDLFKGLDASKLAMNAGIFVAVALATAFGMLAAAIALAAAPFLMFAGLVYSLYRIGSFLVNTWKGIKWSELGSSIVDGIISGLKSGASYLVNAVKNLGGIAWSAFKDKLGIHSPSKVFANLGQQIPRGVQVGVQAGTPALSRSVARVVQVPAAPRMPVDSVDSPVQSTPDQQQSKAPVTITIGDVNIQSSAADAKSIAVDIRSELEKILEGLVVQMGAKVPGGR
jgi:hypothetical protein